MRLHAPSLKKIVEIRSHSEESFLFYTTRAERLMFSKKKRKKKYIGAEFHQTKLWRSCDWLFSCIWALQENGLTSALNLWTNPVISSIANRRRKVVLAVEAFQAAILDTAARCELLSIRGSVMTGPRYCGRLAAVTLTDTHRIDPCPASVSFAHTLARSFEGKAFGATVNSDTTRLTRGSNIHVTVDDALEFCAPSVCGERYT